jgi:gamma-glutamyltranspeptidase/glutathione hydrolase
MNDPRRYLRRTPSFLAVALLAFGAAQVAHADGREGTLGVASTVALPSKANATPPAWTGKAFRQGVVSVANPHAAAAGAQILEQGGNAIDAAVAIAYALNVVEPQSAGIGGGGFMMIHLAKTGETVTVDSREKAPAAATPAMFQGKSFDAASTSGLAVGVPGMVRGTALAIERWGNLTLANVIAPAIRLADDGFAATPRYVDASCNSRARNYPETEAYFCPGGTSRVAVGELVRNEPLAETLRAVASGGPDVFYSGEIANAIIEGQKRFRQIPGAEGGRMTLADLAAYEAAVRAPVTGKYRDYTIAAMGPPSSGALTVLQMLKMVERFPLGDANQSYGFGAPRTLNVMAEAMRIAFADRAVWMGDDDFVHVPSKGLLDPSYVSTRSLLINQDQRGSNPVAGDPRPYDVAGLKGESRLAQIDVFSGPGGSTTHFSVVDKWGNMASYTNTIESSHGAGMFAGYYPADCANVSCFKNFGFLLNNELTDFNFTPVANPESNNFNPGANDVAPNKRPRSSMTPAMIFDRNGKPIIAYGSPGGSTIINSVFNVTLNLIDHGMTIQDAIDAPRLSVTSAGGSVSVDSGAPSSGWSGFPASSLNFLRDLGHTVNTVSDIGSVQAVVVDAKTGKQYGAADSRREGTVIGLPRPWGR